MRHFRLAQSEFLLSRNIDQQEKHHAKKSFKEEWIELLRYAGIEFDESHFD